MEQNIPVSNTWAFSDTKIVDISATWTINNFNFNSKYNKISSPTFKDKENNFTWRLELDLNNEDYARFVIGTLTFVNHDRSQTKTWLQARFSILNSTGKVEHQSMWSSFRPFCKKFKYEQHKIVSKNLLFEHRDELLPFDTLTIFCEIKVKHGITSTSSEDSQDFWSAECESNIMLIIRGREFPAHKEILSRNTYFQSVFEKEPDVQEIALDDYGYDIMLKVLRYIYFQDVKDVDSNTIDSMAAAHKYNVLELKEACEKCLVGKLNIINASSLLMAADLYKAHHLKTTALKFIVSHRSQISETPGYKYLQSASDQKLIQETYSKIIEKESSPSLPDTQYTVQSVYSPISSGYSPSSPSSPDSSLIKLRKPLKKRKLKL